MAVRIARHRATRSSEWVTAEVPANLAEWFNKNRSSYQSIVLDCLTVMVKQFTRASSKQRSHF